MAFKLVLLAATLACANAGLLQPAYSPAAAVSSAYLQPSLVHAPSIGSSQQQVVRSLGGAQAVSTYSKAVDSAFSSVRKFDTRITNDGLLHAPVAYAQAAPIVSSYAQAAPIVSSYSHSAPLVSSYSHAAPVVSYSQAAPVVSSYSHSAPLVSSYSHAAPVVSYSQAAPVVSSYSHSPVVASYAQAAPVVSSYAHAAPVAVAHAPIAYSPAAVVSHASFSGLGASYAW